ncbi:MAG: SufE family protein [Gammaproteobacteria bacterium]
MTEIEQAQAELIEEFQLFDNWIDRYQYIIDMGKNLPEFPQDWRTEENRIRGCQSQVWLKTERRDGRLDFEAISDSAIVSGLIAILQRVYSGRNAAEIIATPPAFIGAIGLDEHLSPTRSNGLNSMINAIQQAARDCAAA